MKKIIGIVLILTVVLFLTACSYSAGNQAANPPTGSTDQSNQPATSDTGTVNIQNFTFNPGMLTVKKGATVTWTNSDSAPHQIKSDTFNSEVLNQAKFFLQL